LSPTDAAGLSERQRSELEAFRRLAQAVGRSTHPTDRLAAERAVVAAYAAAGMAPPRVVWCRGPTELAISRHDEALAREAKGLVLAPIVDAVRKSVDRALAGLVSRPLMVEIRAPLRRSMLDRSILDIMADVPAWQPPPARGLRRVLALLRRRDRPPWSMMPLSQCGFGQHHFGDLAVYGFVGEQFGLDRVVRPIEGLLAVATTCGWIVPHRRVCWICERPDTIAVDADGRLHGSNGPAISYRDGWSHYAWKGMAIPSWLIQQPQDITPARINRERDPAIRHCMIDIMTPARFIKVGGVQRISEDETGVLWRRSWGIWGTWAAVEVVNGTPEPDGTCKRYFLTVPPDVHTPREGVAWTYGLTAREYAKLLLRT
jgi:hypothetical protein